MGKSSKTPKAPDYSGALNTQVDQNKQSWQDALQANRPTQVSDTGSVSWSQDNNGNWTQTSSLNPDQKQLLNSQTGLQQGLTNAATGMMGGLDTSQVNLSGAPRMPGQIDYGKLGSMPGQSDYSGAGAIPGQSDYGSLGNIPGAVDYSKLGDMPQIGGYNQQVIDSLRGLQNPGLQRAEEANRARMAAMGMGTGTGRANQTQEEIMGQTRNDADLKAILAGIQQGNTEFGQGMQQYQQGQGQLENNWQQSMLGRQQGVSELDNLFKQGMLQRQQGVSEADNIYNQKFQGYQQGQGQLENNFAQSVLGHQQGVSDTLAQRNTNLGQLSGLMGLIQNQGAQPSVPGFNTTGQYQVPDYAGAQTAGYNAALNKTNAKNADKSNTLGAIGQTAGAIGSIFGK